MEFAELAKKSLSLVALTRLVTWFFFALANGSFRCHKLILLQLLHLNGVCCFFSVVEVVLFCGCQHKELKILLLGPSRENWHSYIGVTLYLVY